MNRRKHVLELFDKIEKLRRYGATHYKVISIDREMLLEKIKAFILKEFDEEEVRRFQFFTMREWPVDYSPQIDQEKSDPEREQIYNLGDDPSKFFEFIDKLKDYLAELLDRKVETGEA